MEKTNDTKSNFGKYGWGIIGFAALLMCINGIIHTNGINVLLNMLNGMYGWDVSSLLTMNTIAGIIGVLTSFITGRLIIKFGAKRIGGLFLIVGGLAVIWFGRLDNIAAFFICLVILWVFSDGYGQMVPFTLTANWFPRKKGLALGWSTMGYPVGSIVAVPIIVTLVGVMGFSNCFLLIGIVHIVIGIITFFLIHDYPEEIGVAPDNDPAGKEELDKILEHRKNYKSQLTVKKLLKDPNMWCIAIMMGLLWMATIGIVSQLIPRLTGSGYTQDAATHFLQLSSACGLFGSYFFGWLDTKIGTRKTTMIYSWCYVAVLLVLGLSTSVQATIFVCIVGGAGTGAICNLLPSYIGTVYGRDDFAIANGVVSPIASMLRCMNFLILGLGLRINGTYAPSYFIFCGFAVVAFFLAMRTKKVFQEKPAENI